jgi:hypothetical protein
MKLRRDETSLSGASEKHVAGRIPAETCIAFSQRGVSEGVEKCGGLISSAVGLSQCGFAQFLKNLE